MRPVFVVYWDSRRRPCPGGRNGRSSRADPSCGQSPGIQFSGTNTKPTAYYIALFSGNPEFGSGLPSHLRPKEGGGVNNAVILKGNLSQEPYFDVVEGSDLPFLRFYLAVNQRNGLALTLLKGNVVQPPYFDRVGRSDRPFLRLYLAVNRPKRRDDEDDSRPTADFLRVVAYDDAALFSFPYLQPGSELLIGANLRARRRRMSGGKSETVVEAVADDITFLRKIKWREGDAERERLQAAREGQPAPSSASSHPQWGGFFRVVGYGDLALFSYPYLQTGSEVLVRGGLRSRKRLLPEGRRQTVVEVHAQDITFVRKIDWEHGDGERDRILARRAEERA
jgi:single-stranded DNA-binding protein